MRPYVVRPAAAEDIRRAYAWYERAQEGLGEAFLVELRATIDAVLLAPQAYAILHRETQPISVCVAGDGARLPGVAIPSRAVAYDAERAVDPASLNWTVANVGCVTYPGPDRPREPCSPGGAPVPVVVRVLCGQ